MAALDDRLRHWASSWTDAYLAAFAQTLSYMLVTFDAAGLICSSCS